MADQFAQLNGQRITAGNLLIPYYGIWAADVELAAAVVVQPSVTLIIGNLELKGHVFRAADFTGSKSLRIVGGAGGWRKQTTAQPYYSTNGVKKSMVLRDVASSVGESVNVVTDEVIGNFWIRERCIASELLRLLCGDVWWMDEKGVTQVHDRTNTSLIKTNFDVATWSGAAGKFNIATEDLASWLPARTFSSPTVTPVQKISSTSIVINNDGKLRLDVLSTGFADAA